MIYDHKDYIQQETPNDLDHIRVSKNSFKWVNPPKHELDNSKWGNGLKDTAGAKLNELLERYDFVENRFRRNAELIHQTYDHLDDFTSEFFLTLESYQVGEVVYLKKWLRYWKRIYEEVAEAKLIEQDFDDKRFDDVQLDQARENSIEGMYNGDLRANYGKLIGLCPFHEERTPSFTIFTDQNKFHCFGCQASGDAIDFYMRIHNADFVQAVKALI